MLETAIAGVVIPFAVAAIVLGLALAAIVRGHGGAAPALAAIAVSGGYVLAHLVIIGLPSWPPVEARSWIFVFAIASALLGAADAFVARSAYAWAQRIALGLALALALLAPLLRHSWTKGEGLVATLALATLFVIVHASADRLRDRGQPTALAAALAGTSGALAIALVAGGSALLGQLMGALACALTPIFFASFGKSAPRWFSGVTTPAVAIGVAFLAAGTFYAELPRHAALLWAASIPAAALVAAPLTRVLGPRRAWLAIAAAALLPAIIGTALAIAARAATPDPYGGYGG